MYGVINKGLEDLVLAKWDLDTWNKIKQQAGFEDEGILSVKSYPDQLTYKLVQSASDVLQIDLEELLQQYGEFWILHTAERGYSELLNLAGNSFPEFLRNLDMLHSRVSGLLPNLAPPAFRVQNEKENSLELIYITNRHGLVSFMKGLVIGLGKRFGLNCQITQIAEKDQNNNGLVFLITW